MEVAVQTHEFEQTSYWSRHSIQDIHDNMKNWEAKVELLENQDMTNCNDQSIEELNKDYVEYARWLNIQNSSLKENSQLNWSKDGNNNTKYFQSLLRK